MHSRSAACAEPRRWGHDGPVRRDRAERVRPTRDAWSPL